MFFLINSSEFCAGRPWLLLLWSGPVSLGVCLLFMPAISGRGLVISYFARIMLRENTIERAGGIGLSGFYVCLVSSPVN